MVKLNGANSDAGTKWTLQAWVRYYLETYKKNEIKETTFDCIPFENHPRLNLPA